MKKNERVQMSEKELRDMISSTVKDTLISLGIDGGDPIEMQKDFQHLREWRESTDAAKKKGILAAVGFVVVAILGAIVLAVKSAFGG